MQGPGALALGLRERVGRKESCTEREDLVPDLERGSLLAFGRLENVRLGDEDVGIGVRTRQKRRDGRGRGRGGEKILEDAQSAKMVRRRLVVDERQCEVRVERAAGPAVSE